MPEPIEHSVMPQVHHLIYACLFTFFKVVQLDIMPELKLPSVPSLPPAFPSQPPAFSQFPSVPSQNLTVTTDPTKCVVVNLHNGVVGEPLQFAIQV